MRYLSFFFVVVAIVSCSKANKSALESEAKEWKQMDDFHMIMAESFHPYKDSANLAPAKQMAKEMSEAAAQWASAELPDKVSNDEMKTSLQELSTGSQDLLKLVNENAADSLVAKSLVGLHDTFHKIQEGWYGEGKKKEHEHH